MAKVACEDCGRPYGDEHGFPDLIISRSAWIKISTSHDDGGLLCPSCICKRLYDAGIRDVPAAFMSGPIRSATRTEMEALSLIERWEAEKERGEDE